MEKYGGALQERYCSRAMSLPVPKWSTTSITKPFGGGGGGGGGGYFFTGKTGLQSIVRVMCVKTHVLKHVHFAPKTRTACMFVQKQKVQMQT